MPIYEYRCSECSHQAEHLQKISEAPIATCPACGKATYKKMLSAAGFQLKGSGWYATDFRNQGAKPAAKKDDKGESKPDTTKADTKTDAKTEAKSEAKSESKPASKAAAPTVTSD